MAFPSKKRGCCILIMIYSKADFFYDCEIREFGAFFCIREKMCNQEDNITSGSIKSLGSVKCNANCGMAISDIITICVGDCPVPKYTEEVCVEIVLVEGGFCGCGL